MIDIGTLVKWRDGSMGMVMDSHQTDGCSSIAYKIKWFDDGIWVVICLAIRGGRMIKVGDMVAFDFKGESHLAIITEDLGMGYAYGRYTGLIVGSDGDLVPLNADEITVLATPSQVDQWERKKLRKLLDK